MKSTVNAVRVQRSEDAQNIGDFRPTLWRRWSFIPGIDCGKSWS